MLQTKVEFINKKILTLCEAVNIKVWAESQHELNLATTWAESPWLNGIVERHKLVLSEMLNKLLEENHCTLDIAHPGA